MRCVDIQTDFLCKVVSKHLLNRQDKTYNKHRTNIIKNIFFQSYVF